MVKLSKRGSAPKLIENKLPSHIIKVDGKLYNKETGKEIKMTKVSFNEFFGVGNE
jgi:hypothetical protein